MTQKQEIFQACKQGGLNEKGGGKNYRGGEFQIKGAFLSLSPFSENTEYGRAPLYYNVMAVYVS